MRVYADRLAGQLAKGLAPVYLIHGDEPLLAEEACQAVRQRALDEGFSERQVMTVEAGFDWNTLSGYSQSMSLFAERRVLELRLPKGKPGEAGSRALVEWCERTPEDTVLLVWSSRLDKQSQNAKWVKALDSAGVVVSIYPPEPRELPAWAAARMQARGLGANPDIAALLAYRYEGNLLALSQEIEKLALLYPDGNIRADDIQDELGENARFDVFRLVDACLQGDGALAVRVLTGLREEGIAAVLVLWALARELRTLARVASALARGESEDGVFRANGVWPRRQPLVRRALKRFPAGRWLGLLQGASRADRIIKGREPGDAWQALQALGLGICGVRW